MEAYNTSIYPVFEADQVLSQKELNLLVSHLEEQDRITRKNLIGLGIVCGLELTFSTANSVKIGCGTAVTSLGFQINWKETTFTQYHDFEISDQFLKPDYIREPYLDAIFKYATKYASIKKCSELLPTDASDEGKKPIPNNFFQDKLVILLLEMTLIDQKNCVTTNCDDKGKRIQFNMRPLVIPISPATNELITAYQLPELYSKIAFPRYNVPYKNLITAANVLDGFRKVYNDSFLTAISTSIANVFQDFKNILPQGSSLTMLENNKGKITETVDKYKSSLNLQYVWDWIFDIVSTYNEIIEFKKINPSLCCIDESLFPFHVVLGGNSIDDAVYRTPFIKTLNGTNDENAKLKELSLLFEKLVLILSTFEVPKGNGTKITPSSLGNFPISDKAIPYYYNTILELNTKWNPQLTSKNQNDTILSYHSTIPNYTNKPEVKDPLLFDTEPFNFFRIEGHIGKNYQEVLTELSSLKEIYNLPFKVIALNAIDFVGKEVDISEHQGDWGDLELDYDMARTKVFNVTQFVVNWINSNKVKIVEESLMTDATIASLKNILTEVKTLLTDDLTDFLSNYKSFYEIFKNLNILFLFHRFCMTLNKSTLTVIAEDLIDHLDEINEMFLEDAFTVIYDESYKRWTTIYKEMFLSTFLQKNKGIEHKAGVTKGGTFILVYTDSSIFKRKLIPPRYLGLLNTISNYNKSINLGPGSQAIKDEIVSTVVLTKVNFSQALPYDPNALIDCKEQTENIKDNLIKLASYNLSQNYPTHLQEFFIGNISSLLQFQPIFSAVGSTITEKVVLADFYIPYLCCSEGSTINIIIGKEQTTIGDFNPEDFDSEDFNTK
ncbi:hypothetical protein [Flavobacterium cellulosilyticum]|uniref:Uncharacterized protein n=1 Tax=Flavobacterium cellulosilyticum TaxID=2541731 RepID=A0A4R5CFI8_9FLAO|nr:hypothetical protein [Flavobacterium cellulosilyticum]TDD96004.1 hypothetical protein E0F76_12915 [Flavobacterium cellulosilyticum]